MTSAPESPKDERSENSDAAFNLASEEEKKHVQWHPFGEAGFVNAYCEVKAHILIRFRIGNGQEFLACVQRDWKPLGRNELKEPCASTMQPEGDVTWSDRILNRYFLWSEVMHRTYGANGQEQPMFVDIVEPVQGPERQVASLVWLDGVERFDRFLLNAGYKSSHRGFIGMGGMSDGELCISGDDWHYPTREVIESAAKTVQDIASDQRYVNRDGRNFSEAIRQFAGLRIYLSEQRDWVRIVKNPESGIQFVEVLFGPIQLG